jgi:hypothetical protein
LLEGPAGGRPHADEPFRLCLRRIHHAFRRVEEGRLDPEEFREGKLRLLRKAWRDARARGAEAALLRALETLRLTRAINEVELASARAAVSALDAPAPPGV